MGLDGGDQVARAVAVGPPDRVLVLGAEQGGQVDDGVDALDGRRKRVGVGEVAADGGRAGRELGVAADERAAVVAGVEEAGEEARADEAGGAGEEDGGHVFPSC